MKVFSKNKSASYQRYCSYEPPEQFYADGVMQQAMFHGLTARVRYDKIVWPVAISFHFWKHGRAASYKQRVQSIFYFFPEPRKSCLFLNL